MNKVTYKDKILKIGITQGDYNGVGYDVIIKTLVEQQLLEICTPIVYGISKVAQYRRKLLNINNFSFNVIHNSDQANPKRPNLVNFTNVDVPLDLGKSTEIAGQMSLEAIDAAIDDLKKGKIDAIVTAPINKHNIPAGKFHFTGHTEYLSNKFDVKDYLMLLVSDNLKVGVVTEHIPLREVADRITEDLIYSKLKILNHSLIKDFVIEKPKIAVLGLNPHSGDLGLLGKEEETTIIPAIKRAFNDNILAFGPFPADGFFGSMHYQKYDAVLAMYHDQGLGPFKTISFNNGVNYTAGLPIIRTSPVHGTAYELAGKHEASNESFLSAIYLAIDIYKNRTLYQEITENPLKTHKLEKDDGIIED